MQRYILLSILLAIIVSLTSALPVLDSDLAASPFIHEQRRSMQKAGKQVKYKKP